MAMPKTTEVYTDGSVQARNLIYTKTTPVTPPLHVFYT